MPVTMSFSSPIYKKNIPADLRVDIPHMANGMQAYNSNTHNRLTGGTESSSPVPFIKDEPQDEGRFIPQQQQAPYHHHPDAYSLSSHQQFHQQQGGFNEPNYNGGDGSIDPSELTMSPSIPIQQNGGFMETYRNYPSDSNNSGYNMASGAIDDDELLALGDLDDPRAQNNNQFGINSHQHDPRSPHGEGYTPLHHIFALDGGANRGPPGENGASTGPDHIYSNTPDHAPVGSPFIHPFQPTQQFRQLQHPYNGAAADTPSSYNASPVVGSDSTQGTNFDQYMDTGKRKARPILERGGSRKSPNSPHTPKTPGIGALSLGGDSSSVPAQPIQTAHMGSHRHQKSLSDQWGGTPGSQVSYIDSPLSSPGQASHIHAQISDVFKSGKHASLPAKVENPIGGGPTFQTQEAKRRRRRESHNMVERRRRDNINERIQELSHLVPQHRLEDEKVRKHLVNNGSLSPSVGPGGSPPRATSMLAGGGRRASGVSSAAGMSSEEKDKGPNKGDILNGAVGWTRDLMWALHEKLEQEKELRDLISRLGGTYPFKSSEDDQRMSSELYAAIEKNGAHSFHYSRAAGTALRVPGYTDYAGNAVGADGSVLSPRVSPSHSGGKHSQNGGSARGTPQQQSQYWSPNDDAAFKEEDEYNSMDMS